MAAKSKKSNVSGGKKRRPSSTGRSISSRISSSSDSESSSGSRTKSNRVTSKGSIGGSSSGTTYGTSTTSAVDTSAQRLASVRSRWDDVAGDLTMTALHDEIERVTVQLDTLRHDISDARARGYRFGRGWEEQYETLNGRWQQQRQDASRLLEEQRRTLRNSVRDVETLLQRAARDNNLISTAESRVSDFSFNLDRAQQRVRSTYDDTRNQISTVAREVAEAQELLDAIDEATFDLLPDEHPVKMCRAVWESDDEQPEGVLFLTDHRLVFEQREEVAAKKVLFITTKKELIQEKLWEAPVGAVAELEAEDERAFLKRRELLTLRFHERTRELPGDIVLRLRGSDNDTWQKIIRHVKSGRVDADRFGAPPPEEQLAEEVEEEATQPEAELPTHCSRCNAPLPPIFKGMQQITCEYCGNVMNL